MVSPFGLVIEFLSAKMSSCDKTLKGDLSLMLGLLRIVATTPATWGEA